MFLAIDYLYIPARDIEASLRYYTGQLGGELVWKIHAFGARVAAIRLSATGPLVLLADHLQGDTPFMIYRVESRTDGGRLARAWLDDRERAIRDSEWAVLHFSRPGRCAAGHLEKPAAPRGAGIRRAY